LLVEPRTDEESSVYLVTVVAVTALIVAPGLTVTCAICLGTDQIRRSAAELDRRTANIAPYLGLVALLSAFKHATSETRARLSRALGWNITDSLYAAEGLFVAHLQTAVPDAFYGFFTWMYMFGFPYLLAVPPVVYFLSPSQRYLKEVLVAYLLNHGVGMVCYTLFVAYGPRNWVSTRVDGTMYRMYPWTQELTAAVSSNTNVFPSLHTSLSVVALLFAWRTRRRYPVWFYLAAFTAASVVLSTMVLGIHWLTDLVAGVALGAWSVVVAERIVARLRGGVATAAAGDEGTPGANVGD
jgi:membrane-associated phospholipid phosphatase